MLSSFFGIASKPGGNLRSKRKNKESLWGKFFLEDGDGTGLMSEQSRVHLEVGTSLNAPCNRISTVNPLFMQKFSSRNSHVHTTAAVEAIDVEEILKVAQNDAALAGVSKHHMRGALKELETLLGGKAAALEAVSVNPALLATSANDLQQSIPALWLVCGYSMAQVLDVASVAPKLLCESPENISEVFPCLAELLGGVELAADALRRCPELLEGELEASASLENAMDRLVRVTSDATRATLLAQAHPALLLGPARGAEEALSILQDKFAPKEQKWPKMGFATIWEEGGGLMSKSFCDVELELGKPPAPGRDRTSTLNPLCMHLDSTVPWRPSLGPVNEDSTGTTQAEQLHDVGVEPWDATVASDCTAQMGMDPLMQMVLLEVERQYQELMNELTNNLPGEQQKAVLSLFDLQAVQSLFITQTVSEEMIDLASEVLNNISLARNRTKMLRHKKKQFSPSSTKTIYSSDNGRHEAESLHTISDLQETLMLVRSKMIHVTVKDSNSKRDSMSAVSDELRTKMLARRALEDC